MSPQEAECGGDSCGACGVLMAGGGRGESSIRRGGVRVPAATCDPDLPLSSGHRAAGRRPWSPQRVCFLQRSRRLDPWPHRLPAEAQPEEAVGLLSTAASRVSDSGSEGLRSSGRGQSSIPGARAFSWDPGAPSPCSLWQSREPLGDPTPGPGLCPPPRGRCPWSRHGDPWLEPSPRPPTDQPHRVLRPGPRGPLHPGQTSVRRRAPHAVALSSLPAALRGPHRPPPSRVGASAVSLSGPLRPVPGWCFTQTRHLTRF